MAVEHANESRNPTRERQSAEALREGDRSFREMLERIGLIALLLDRNARIIYCNDHFLHLTGYARADVIGADFHELFSAPYESDRRRIFEKLLAGDPKLQRHETDIRVRSGERRLIRCNNTLLRAPSGEVTGLATLAEDITDQRVAEAELEYAATHDATTGLPLFGAIEEYLQTACAEAAAHDGRVIVLYLDLDRFHATNETRGRAAGDYVLRAVAQRLREAIGTEGLVGHVAGDEFAI